jgi:hypothetical protein
MSRFTGQNESGRKENLMKKEMTTKKAQRIASNQKQPLRERDNPLARDAGGSARREEIRAKAPMVSAPRQSKRPMERSRQKPAPIPVKSGLEHHRWFV